MSEIERLKLEIYDPENVVMVRQCDNGFEVSKFTEWNHSDEPGSGRIVREVFNLPEHEMDNKGELECITDMFFSLVEFLDISLSCKYSKYCLEIEIKEQEYEN
jgi:hypothetical protein